MSLKPTLAEPAGVFERVAGYYDRLVAEHGYGPRACDYGSERSQRIKFEVLASTMPLRGRRVLDVGCGFADFADYLAGRWGELAYEGLDLSPSMIEEARRRHPGLALRCGNVLEADLPGDYDLVTANGIFYLLGDEAPVLMPRIIERLFSLCRHAVAFNTLSTWAPRRDPGEFQADPASVLAFCRTLTRRVVLRHDYLPHDFTVLLFREGAEP
jgi:SAM-dependent methyltransferase